MDSPWGRKGSGRIERLSLRLSYPMRGERSRWALGAGPEVAVHGPCVHGHMYVGVQWARVTVVHAHTCPHGPAFS